MTSLHRYALITLLLSSTTVPACAQPVFGDAVKPPLPLPHQNEKPEVDSDFGFNDVGIGDADHGWIDDVFDFELYAAYPETVYAWVIVYELSNGQEVTRGRYDNRNAALQAAFLDYARGREPAGTVNVQLKQQEVLLPPEWVFLGKFDTLAEAQAVSDRIEDAGNLTSIRFVREW